MNDFSPVFSSLTEEYPLSQALKAFILQSRATIADILTGKDKRTLLIVGPCSIHHADAALEYAQRLQELSKDVSDTFYIVMRTYMEKSRTSLGWKGFLSDPDRDNSCNVHKGISSARTFLLELARMGVPAASEFLDPLLSPFYSDLISWGSIGARTVQSPIHRQLASTLSMPVGFKNRTDGNIDVALEAIEVALHPHIYLGANSTGSVQLQKSAGNSLGHLVLRGGDTRSNYDFSTLLTAQKKLTAKGLLDAIVVDCSHGNAEKNHKNQITVFESSMRAIQNGMSSLKGVMLESFLQEGRTDSPKLSYGTSVTDPCLHFQETAALIRAHATQEVLV